MSSSSDQDDFKDISKHAQSVLDYVIAGEGEEKILHQASQMPVSEALDSEPILNFASERDKSRILFISSEKTALQEGSAIQKQVINLKTVFSEVHLLVITKNKQAVKTRRIDDNVWLYNVNFSYTLFLPQILVSFAESQLQFVGGFRPDIIVALDPFFAGLAAQALAKRYKRPVQIHVTTDFWQPNFIEQSKANKRKYRLARKVLRRAKSVRTNSSMVRNRLEQNFPKISDLGILPRHFDTDEILSRKRTNKLKEKYPQYVFVILTAGELNHESTIFRTIDAARTILLSPRIGMVILGDGPMKREFVERTELLGIKEQVVFEPNMQLLPEYMLSADLFICTDTTQAGDEYVIQAAAAGLPIVMAKTPLREDLFANEVSGLFNEPDDTLGFTQKINSVLNTNAYRLQFGVNARQVVRDRLHTDPELYRKAYRDSIEVIFGKAEKSKADVVDEVSTGEAGNLVNPPAEKDNVTATNQTMAA